MIPLLPVQNEVHRLCMAEWAKYKQGLITKDELILECAYIDIAHNLDLFVSVSEPSKPMDLIKYEQMEFKDRQKVSSSFWREPEIAAYMTAKANAVRETQTYKYRLNEILGILPKEDIVNREKIQQRLGRFLGAMSPT